MWQVALIAVGVPEIVPVDVSKDKPGWQCWETDQEVTAPPVEEGVTLVIADPFAMVNEFGE
jgi:hypothetical protein